MFREITINDKPWIDRCWREGPNDMSVLTFPAVYTWQSTFGLTIDGDEQFYIIKSDADQGYYYPVGEEAACRSYVRRLLEEAASAPSPDHAAARLKFVYVPESELGWLEDLGFTVMCEPDTSEYVYSSRSLALEDNGSGTNYRVKVKHFSRDNQWTSKTLVFPDDEALLREKIRQWAETSHERPEARSAQQSGAPGNHYSDRLAAISVAQEPTAIGISGVYIETDQQEWAVLLGYPTTDKIYNMSIVKYSPHISRNVVPVCICEMAKRVCSEYPLTNLEDDVGVPGLRRMKQLYHPLFLLDSYTAFCSVQPAGR